LIPSVPNFAALDACGAPVIWFFIRSSLRGDGLAGDRDLVAGPLADRLAELLVGALHLGMVLGDVPARGVEEILVVRAAELVAAGAVDDATHV
jgi:hypothetical protein